MEVKSMPGYRVRKRDDKYEVLYPSGKVRCRVDDGELAYEIANDLMRERSQEPTPVRCVESGEIFNEVLYPSGKVRCRVDDGELAYEIANDLMRERSQEPTPVRCVESGEIFKDHYEASGAHTREVRGVRRDLQGPLRSS